jgi:hypothetical protein
MADITLEVPINAPFVDAIVKAATLKKKSKASSAQPRIKGKFAPKSEGGSQQSGLSIEEESSIYEGCMIIQYINLGVLF